MNSRLSIVILRVNLELLFLLLLLLLLLLLSFLLLGLVSFFFNFFPSFSIFLFFFSGATPLGPACIHSAVFLIVFLKNQTTGC